VAKQAVFELNNTPADLVGFWIPSYLAGVNNAGYHFHALTKDKKAGGHVLDCQSKQITIELDTLYQFNLQLPNDFAEMELKPAGEQLKQP
jgi:acetolactate decarboxylase